MLTSQDISIAYIDNFNPSYMPTLTTPHGCWRTHQHCKYLLLLTLTHLRKLDTAHDAKEVFNHNYYSMAHLLRCITPYTISECSTLRHDLSDMTRPPHIKHSTSPCHHTLHPKHRTYSPHISTRTQHHKYYLLGVP